MDYPTPLLVPPRRLPHKQTFIILHGRGSSAEKFGPLLLEAPFPAADGSSITSQPTTSTLAFAFPNARFVFPSAPRRRATIYKRSWTHQWFDNWDLTPPATEREELQEAGLRETATFLHELLAEEIKQVPGGAQNVFLGGLSQGSASSLTAMLLWEGEPLGAVFGMCGWLPYATRIKEQCEGQSRAIEQDKEEEFDPFDREPQDDNLGHGDDTAEMKDYVRAATWLRREIEMESPGAAGLGVAFQKTPLFLGHGVLDDRVDVRLGRTAASAASMLGAAVAWHEYEGLGHWYSEAMLNDLVEFLSSRH